MRYLAAVRLHRPRRVGRGVGPSAVAASAFTAMTASACSGCWSIPVVPTTAAAAASGAASAPWAADRPALRTGATQRGPLCLGASWGAHEQAHQAGTGWGRVRAGLG